jgi:hypothetical protein
MHGSVNDGRMHRAKHRKTLRALKPAPSPRLAKLFKQYGSFVPVKRSSSLWLRARLYEIARAFRNEVRISSTPYSIYGTDPEGDGYLMVSENGANAGGFHATWYNYTNHPAQWELDWIWVAPKCRRQGWLRRSWKMACEKYPGIQPSPPFLSEGAAKFFRSSFEPGSWMPPV